MEILPFGSEPGASPPHPVPLPEGEGGVLAIPQTPAVSAEPVDQSALDTALDNLPTGASSVPATTGRPPGQAGFRGKNRRTNGRLKNCAPSSYGHAALQPWAGRIYNPSPSSTSREMKGFRCESRISIVSAASAET